jgi:hypothetical protein
MEDVPKKDLVYCLGMSKMTVSRENSQAKQHDQVQFVEFLEMIGRVAALRYVDSEVETEPLHIKIEIILDDLFEEYGLIRQPSVGDVSDTIDGSDSDY